MGQDDQTSAWGALSSVKDEPDTVPAALPPFRVGKVLSDTFSTFFANFLRFWALSLTAFAPMLVVMVLVGVMAAAVGRDAAPAPDAAFGSVGVFIVMMALMFVAVFHMMAAISYGAVEYQAGRKATFSAMFKAGLRALVPVLIAGILTGILYMIGAILLIVPGIIVLLMLSVATPAIVFERLGPFEGLRRSRELTSGHKWSILGFFILMFLVMMVANILIMMPLSLVSLTMPGEVGIQLVSGLASLLLTGAYYGFMGSGVASVYTNLRAAKEGASADDIAKVFE